MKWPTPTPRAGVRADAIELRSLADARFTQQDQGSRPGRSEVTSDFLAGAAALVAAAALLSLLWSPRLP